MKCLLNFMTISAVFSVLNFGCSPTVALIDRQTVLELEASGDWQELDKGYHAQELQSGPIPLEKMREKIERRPVLSMTHGDDSTALSPSGNKKGQ